MLMRSWLVKIVIQSISPYVLHYFKLSNSFCNEKTKGFMNIIIRTSIGSFKKKKMEKNVIVKENSQF